MGAFHESTFGLLLYPLMRWVHTHGTSVLALTHIMLHLHLNHLALLGMTTFVILVAKIITSLSSMVMIHYGMELVVDQPTPAAL